MRLVACLLSNASGKNTQKVFQIYLWEFMHSISIIEWFVWWGARECGVDDKCRISKIVWTSRSEIWLRRNLGASMLAGKLKDLGNSVLGHFGMSVDNFKAVKDPATGSYSINFQKWRISWYWHIWENIQQTSLALWMADCCVRVRVYTCLTSMTWHISCLDVLVCLSRIPRTMIAIAEMMIPRQLLRGWIGSVNYFT